MANDQADKQPTVEEPTVPAVEDSPSSEKKEIQSQSEVSEEISEQNRAFAQMRQEIKELKTQLEEANKLIPQPEVPQYQTPSYTTSTYVDINKYIDPNTGEVNIQEYNQAVNAAFANQVNYNQNFITQEVDIAQVRLAYPQLDETSDQYDPDFAEEVASRHWYRTSLGQKVSLRQIAKEIITKIQKNQQKEADKIIVETAQVNAEKQVASLETPAQSSSAARTAQTRLEEEEEDEELKYQTRGLKGDVFSGQRYSERQQVEAAVKRLQKIPWKKEEVQNVEETGT